MIYQLKPYWDALMAERTSSWAVFTILYLFAGLFIRSWFVGPVFARLKLLERPLIKEVKRFYLRESFMGWLFFLLPPLILLIFWNNPAVPIHVNETILFAVSTAAFIFSILLHLIAFGVASVSALKKVSETQEKRLFEA